MPGVPNIYANLTGNIALSTLDVNFATPVTIGNVSVGLGNTVTDLTGLGNVGMTGNLVYSGTSLYTGVEGTGKIAAALQLNWTPADASGQSLAFSLKQGFSRKSGNMVFTWGVVTYPVTANGAQAAINALPFSPTASGTNNVGCLTILPTANVGPIAWMVSPSATTILAANLQTGAAVTNAQLSTLTLYFFGVYATDT